MLIPVISLILIIAVLLILVVLMQNSKGGLGAMGGGGSASQLIGVKKASDVLEKSTWILIVLIIGLSIVANVLLKPETTEKAIGEGVGGAKATQQQAAPATEPALQPQTEEIPTMQEEQSSDPSAEDGNQGG